MLQVVLSVKPEVQLGVQVSSCNAAALPSLSGPSWSLSCVSLLLREHGARAAAELLLQIRMGGSYLEACRYCCEEEGH